MVDAGVNPFVVVGGAIQGPPSDVQQAQAQAAGAAQFKALAAAGGFGITQEGFDIMIKAIYSCQDDEPKLRNKLPFIKQGMALGTAPVALAVNRANQSIASGTPNSLETVLGLYFQTLDDIEAGLKQALRNYQDDEDHNKAALQRVLGEKG